MSDVSVRDLLEIAKRAAKRAGEALVEEYRAVFDDGKDLETSEKTAPNDVVTAVDGRVQQVVIAEIQSDFPDHRYIAEEDGAESLGDPNCPYEWILDPLDGTLNFVHGRQNFGSIVAVQKDNTLLAGAMIIPLLDQFFYGARGLGAFYNDDPVRLRNTKDMSDAILCSNSVRRAKPDEHGILQISTPACASFENYGSAVEEIGEILRGHNDGIFFHGPRLWDIAAGFLMIEEAGGKMRYQFTEEGNPRSSLLAVASTAAIFEELWEWSAENL